MQIMDNVLCIYSLCVLCNTHITYIRKHRVIWKGGVCLCSLNIKVTKDYFMYMRCMYLPHPILSRNTSVEQFFRFVHNIFMGVLWVFFLYVFLPFHSFLFIMLSLWNIIMRTVIAFVTTYQRLICLIFLIESELIW